MNEKTCLFIAVIVSVMLCQKQISVFEHVLLGKLSSAGFKRNKPC